MVESVQVTRLCEFLLTIKLYKVNIILYSFLILIVLHIYIGLSIQLFSIGLLKFDGSVRTTSN